MDASCFCCQFSLNTAGIIIGVYEIVQYTLLFFFALHFFKGRALMSFASDTLINSFNLHVTFSFSLLEFQMTQIFSRLLPAVYVRLSSRQRFWFMDHLK
jgi:hypothetical protein